MAETPGFGLPAHHVLALARSDAGTGGDAQGEHGEHTRSAHVERGRAHAVPAAEARGAARVRHLGPPRGTASANLMTERRWPPGTGHQEARPGASSAAGLGSATPGS